MAVSQKKKKKRIILVFLSLIASLVVISSVIFFFIRLNSTSRVKEESKENKRELEKYLQEKRLDLKKYFVFNLGKEVKSESSFSHDGQNINNPFVRQLNSSLAADLTKLLGQKKDLIIFAGANKDTLSLEWTNSKLDEKIRNGAETYIIFDKTKISAIDCAFFRKETGFSTAFTLAVLAEPEVKIWLGKAKALDFLQKNDPLFTGKNPNDNPPPSPQNPQPPQDKPINNPSILPQKFSPPSPPASPQNLDNSQKKLLAQKIKEIVKEDLEKVKKGIIEPTYIIRENFGDILCRRAKELGEKETISQADLEKKDWDEIFKLNQQLEKLNREKIKEREKKVNENKDEKTFYYLAKTKSGKIGNDYTKNEEEQKTYCFFKKRWNGFTHRLRIVADHPSLVKFSFPDGGGDDKMARFYLIEGVELDSFVKVQTTNSFIFEKEIDLTDKITITPTSL